ncbi:MAG: hypothetical protein ACLVMH_11645 [Christensenellales bacterium]
MTLNDILELADVRNYHLSVKIGRALTSCIECDTRNEPQLEDIEMLYGSYRVTRLGSCGSALEVDLETA